MRTMSGILRLACTQENMITSGINTTNNIIRFWAIVRQTKGSKRSYPE